jgi:membrane-associated protease RseP (regulator of RpoE activity)
MRGYFLIALMVVALAMCATATDQMYEPTPEIYGFSSEDAGTGAYLGVDISDVTPERMSALKLSKEQGVEVTMVDQDAPAGKAGIKEHDVILSMNGTPIESGAQLRRMIHETPADRVITLGISRSGKPLELQVKLAERSTKFAFKMPPMPRTPIMLQNMDVPVSVVVVHSMLHSGLMIENLTPQLGDYFGAKNGNGVLVRSVEKGSRAEKAGFRAGDVIVRVDKEMVHDASDFSSALRAHRGNQAVPIGIIRDKKEQTISLMLPPPRQSGDLFDEQSFALPDIDINADVDWESVATAVENVTPQIAVNIKPHMEMALKEAQEFAQQAQKQAHERQRELREQQKDLQKQLEQQRHELEKQMRHYNHDWQHEMKKQQEELRRELRELQMGSAEI